MFEAPCDSMFRLGCSILACARKDIATMQQMQKHEVPRSRTIAGGYWCCYFCDYDFLLLRHVLVFAPLLLT